MAKQSIKKQFDTDGSSLASPVSPASPQPLASVNDINGILHNQYSNIGDPNSPNQAYNNFGAGQSGYNVPSTSQLGEATEAYQKPENRYANNLPDGAAGI